jgi:hypothetical protein
MAGAVGDPLVRRQWGAARTRLRKNLVPAPLARPRPAPASPMRSSTRSAPQPWAPARLVHSVSAHRTALNLVMRRSSARNVVFNRENDSLTRLGSLARVRSGPPWFHTRYGGPHQARADPRCCAIFRMGHTVVWPDNTVWLASVHGWADIPDHVDYLSFRPSQNVLQGGWVNPTIAK